jgi:hypothetical protein
MWRLCVGSLVAGFALLVVEVSPAKAEPLRGTIVDEATGKPLAARLYIRSADGKWHFAASADPAGKAVSYDKERGPQSFERHTTLSAHPFTADLPPGKYTLTAERGKEYLPAEATIEIGDAPASVELKLHRWINMAERGWYSGDTHVHRTLEELPTAMLADDVNVALPLTYWVTKSSTPPAQGDKNLPPVEPKLITVSPQHVIWPLNTEYEIFTVGGKQHTLGAVFGLGHKTVLERGAPPVRPIAEQVHREGGLLDLDKHNWPWSMALVPVMNVDLYELANNHHWRTDFFFRQFGEGVPAYMKIGHDPAGLDERAWTEFGFQNYYALLNCGFRLMPTAGTASGVHPVPLGWGRVYVHCPEGFSYENWMKGLKEGRSFVTTGPILEFTILDETRQAISPRGNSIAHEGGPRKYILEAETRGTAGNRRVEFIRDGALQSTHTMTSTPQIRITPESRHTLEDRIDVAESTWVSARCYELLPDGRERFAHSAPIFIDIPGKPLRPRKAEVEYLISRVEGEIERNKQVLSPEALAEFQEALAKYQEIAKTAK